MEWRIHRTTSIVAELLQTNRPIAGVQDVLDLMTDPGNDGARHLLLHRGQLADEFFNLRSGLLGEILQKFVTYGMKLAILGDFSQHPSRSFRDFVRECNRGHQIYFLPESRTALESLTRN